MQRWVIAPASIAVLSAVLLAQDRLKTMPEYGQHQKIAPQIASAIKYGALSATWTADGTAIEYDRDGRWYRFEVETRQARDLGLQGNGSGGQQGSFGPEPERGRQFTTALSPDGKLRASYRDRNLWLSAADGTNEIAITTDGSLATRVKYGTASWVYGEELEQRTAMWWSPDSRKIAFYRFDEKQVPDYYVTLNQTRLQDTIDSEAYPKAGVNPPSTNGGHGHAADT